MASSGKKNKTKWKTVDLANVIPNTGLTLPRKTTNSWAEESELDQNEFEYSRKMDNITLPTAPRAARAEDNDAKIPQDPPYIAYLSNLPYDLNEDELTNIIQEMNVNVKIKSVTLPREERATRFKGFGYVEFEDRASFVNVMNEFTDLSIKGRRVRLDVSSGEGGRGGRGMRGGGGGGSEPDYITKDWRASGPPPDRDDDGYKRREYGDRGGGFGRRDDRRGGFGDRDRDRGYRDRGFRDDNREWSRDGDRDRGGGGGGGNWREDNRDRDRDRGGGYGRSNYDDRRSESSSGSWRRERDDYDRERRSPERSEPKSRPKITLQPRTKPIEEATTETDTSAAAIFGGAKPVNTAAREREIEERLARQSAVDDAPRRKGPSSYDSWDRDRDRARDRDMDRDQGDKDEDPDKDRGQDDDYHRKDNYDDYDRKSESDERDIDVDKERVSSRDGESRDVPDAPRKLEPAPPPKENAWARRQQNNNSSSNNSTVNNGRTSPSEPDTQSKSRGSSPRPPTRDDSSSSEGPVRKYQPPRGQSSEQRRGDKKPSHEESKENSKGSSVTGRPAATSRPKAVTQGTGRPREQKKDDRDEKLRMPKFEEQKAPNFAGSNKYAFLDEANETAAN